VKSIRLIGIALAGLIIAGCHPADEKSKTVKQRLEAGELVEFTDNGYMRPACTHGAWEDARLGEDPERARVILGKQQAIINTNMNGCQQVGSTPYMNVFKGDKGPQVGRVLVTKIGLVKASKIKSNYLSGRFFAQSTDYNAYITDKLTPRNGDPAPDIVMIVTFKYVSGTAVDESDVRKGDVTPPTPAPPGPPTTEDGYSETNTNGQMISDSNTCKRAWDSVAVPSDFQPPMLAGTLKSWYRLGDMNCLPQGATIALNNKVGEKPGFMQVKVTRVKRFRTAFVDEKFFDLNGFDYALLKAKIDADNAAKPSDWMTVVDFEPVGPAVMEDDHE
jgi:hypothetical protein